MTVGSWKPVAGSSGAGHVSADLAFQNTSKQVCGVAGYPRLTLHSADGKVLPTAMTDFGPATVPRVTVLPSAWVHSELRYSPDIPGPDEPQSGPCEPAAAYALVQLPGDGTTTRVTLSPPTTVCVEGAIQAKPFTAGPATAPGG